MGPKDKDKGKKGKEPEPVPDTSEHVTELMKQFFKIQMTDIEKKMERLQNQQYEFKEMTEKVEQSIAEHQEEKGAVIEEMKAFLERKKEEKLLKRDELQWLGDEIQFRKKKFEKSVAEKEEAFEVMVEELTRDLENKEEDLRILEDFKTKKAEYIRELEQGEESRMEMERQHHRNLFEIRKKLEMAKVRLKKDFHSRLLQLSIDFQETSRIKIGAPIHRMLQENRAIENELNSIKSFLAEYHSGYESFKESTIFSQAHEKATVEENDKYIARCIIQENIIEALSSENKELSSRLNEYLPLQMENDNLTKQYKDLDLEITKKKSLANEVRGLLAEKRDEAYRMSEVNSFVRKNTRKLQIVTRNALKATEEAMAIQFIPFGETEEEKHISPEGKLKLYQKRRDLAFKKKGKFLMNLQDILLRAQMSEEEWRMLSDESLSTEYLDFETLFASPISGEIYEEEIEIRRGFESSMSTGLSGSDKSLPRSLTPDIEEAAAEPEEEEPGIEDSGFTIVKSGLEMEEASEKVKEVTEEVRLEPEDEEEEAVVGEGYDPPEEET